MGLIWEKAEAIALNRHGWCLSVAHCVYLDTVYRVVQKTDTQFYFWDNFGYSAQILTILSLLQAEIYGA